MSLLRAASNLAGTSVERWSLIAALATMAVWGVNFTVVKYVLEHTGVGPFLFIRYLVMPLLGLALLAVVYRRHLPKSWPQREDLPRFVACGLVGHTAHVGLVTWGISLSTPFSSALVLTSGPLFTLLILAFAGAEKLRGRQIAGTTFAFAGIVIRDQNRFIGHDEFLNEVFPVAAPLDGAATGRQKSSRCPYSW